MLSVQPLSVTVTSVEYDTSPIFQNFLFIYCKIDQLDEFYFTIVTQDRHQGEHVEELSLETHSH